MVRRPSWVQAEEHDPAGDQESGDVRVEHDQDGDDVRVNRAQDPDQDDRDQDRGDVHVDRDNVQGIEVCRIGLMFPIYSISYILCPWISFSQVSYPIPLSQVSSLFHLPQHDHLDRPHDHRLYHFDFHRSIPVNDEVMLF